MEIQRQEIRELYSEFSQHILKICVLMQVDYCFFKFFHFPNYVSFHVLHLTQNNTENKAICSCFSQICASTSR